MIDLGGIFRGYRHPERDDAYDGWAITIRREQTRSVQVEYTVATVERTALSRVERGRTMLGVPDRRVPQPRSTLHRYREPLAPVMIEESLDRAMGKERTEEANDPR